MQPCLLLVHAQFQTFNVLPQNGCMWESLNVLTPPINHNTQSLTRACSHMVTRTITQSSVTSAGTCTPTGISILGQLHQHAHKRAPVPRVMHSTLCHSHWNVRACRDVCHHGQMQQHIFTVTARMQLHIFTNGTP